MQNKRKDNNSSKKNSAANSLKRTIVIVSIIAVGLIILTIGTMLLSNYGIFEDIFSTEVSNSHQMNIPFTIVVEILASTGGIVLGLQIDNYVDERKNIKDFENLKTTILEYLKKMKSGIDAEVPQNDKECKLIELSRFQLHWEVLIKSEPHCVNIVQEKKWYFELTYIFNFLNYNQIYWLSDHAGKTVSQLKQHCDIINEGFMLNIDNWIQRIKAMIKTIEDDK